MGRTTLRRRGIHDPHTHVSSLPEQILSVVAELPPSEEAQSATVDTTSSTRATALSAACRCRHSLRRGAGGNEFGIACATLVGFDLPNDAIARARSVRRDRDDDAGKASAMHRASSSTRPRSRAIATGATTTCGDGSSKRRSILPWSSFPRRREDHAAGVRIGSSSFDLIGISRCVASPGRRRARNRQGGERRRVR